MSTELVILVWIFAFVILGVFVGPNGLKATFESASPRLGAKAERYLETGGGFTRASQTGGRASDPINWVPRGLPAGGDVK